MSDNHMLMITIVIQVVDLVDLAEVEDSETNSEVVHLAEVCSYILVLPL